MKKSKRAEKLLFSNTKELGSSNQQQVMDSNGNYIYPSDYVMDSPNKAYSTSSLEIYK